MSWGDETRRKIARIKSDRVILQAAGGTMLEMAERIWTRGQLTDGTQVTYKEDYEVWATVPPWPRKGKQRGKTGKKIKSTYYKTYLAGKRDVSRSYFELTGDLRKDWLGGVTPKPTEVNELRCVIDLGEQNARKADGLTESKGAFLALSAAEIASHTRRVNDLWRDILRS